MLQIPDTMPVLYSILNQVSLQKEIITSISLVKLSSFKEIVYRLNLLSSRKSLQSLNSNQLLLVKAKYLLKSTDTISI